MKTTLGGVKTEIPGERHRAALRGCHVGQYSGGDSLPGMTRGGRYTLIVVGITLMDATPG